MDEITKLRNKVNKIEKERISCTDKNRKSQLAEEATRYRKEVSKLCLEGVRRYSNDIKEPGNLTFDFDKVYAYFHAGYKYPTYYLNEDWELMLSCYETFIVEERDRMYDMKSAREDMYGISENKEYKDIFVHEEIKELESYCKYAVKNSTGYKGYEGYEKSFKRLLYRDIQILYAESFNEKRHWYEAIKIYEEIYEGSKNSKGAFELSNLLCLKGQVYHTIGLYELAIKDYDQAISLLEQRDHYGNRGGRDQIEYIKEQRSKADAMLEQQMLNA